MRIGLNVYLRKTKTFLKLLGYSIVFPFYKWQGTPHVLSVEDTLHRVINDKLSVARFGDGEYYHLIGKSTGLQQNDVILQNKLKETILCRNPKLLVCMVDFLNQKNCKIRKKLSFSYHYVRIYKKIKAYVDAGYKYGDTNLTRLYVGVKNKSNCSFHFGLCKQIWEGADIVIFEGDKTRFGIGNDLFDNVKSIRRILCPSKNAFKYYDQILDKAKTFDKNCLLLFSLGITATVAAKDLTDEGYRVIDIGNLDVEYEWLKLGVKKRVVLKGKQVGEIVEGTIVEEITDENYLEQIAGKIGINE